jgi:hypothetical protein
MTSPGFVGHGHPLSLASQTRNLPQGPRAGGVTDDAVTDGERAGDEVYVGIGSGAGSTFDASRGPRNAPGAGSPAPNDPRKSLQADCNRLQ